MPYDTSQSEKSDGPDFDFDDHGIVPSQKGDRHKKIWTKYRVKSMLTSCGFDICCGCVILQMFFCCDGPYPWGPSLLGGPSLLSGLPYSHIRNDLNFLSFLLIFHILSKLTSKPPYVGILDLVKNDHFFLHFTNVSKFQVLQKKITKNPSKK